MRALVVVLVLVIAGGGATAQARLSGAVGSPAAGMLAGPARASAADAGDGLPAPGARQRHVEPLRAEPHRLHRHRSRARRRRDDRATGGPRAPRRPAWSSRCGATPTPPVPGSSSSTAGSTCPRQRAGPDGPYPVVSEIDVSPGRCRTTAPCGCRPWRSSRPQNGGGWRRRRPRPDLWPCPAAGLTTESTPSLRGFVDHPAVPGLTSSGDTPTTRQPSGRRPAGRHSGDGARRDPGRLRLRLVRAAPDPGWRPMTPASWRRRRRLRRRPGPALRPGAGRGRHRCRCRSASRPAPTAASSARRPVSGSAARHMLRQPHGHRPAEQLTGPCDGVTPLVTPSQEGLPERLPGEGLGAVRPATLARARARILPSSANGSGAGFAGGRRLRAGVRAAGVRGRAARAACADALAHLARARRSGRRERRRVARGRPPRPAGLRARGACGRCAGYSRKIACPAR